jgi:hypothetical protein
LKTREVYRMVECTVVARKKATLENQQLHGTQCIYSAMCFTNCCVHTDVLNVYVQVLRKLISVMCCYGWREVRILTTVMQSEDASKLSACE